MKWGADGDFEACVVEGVIESAARVPPEVACILIAGAPETWSGRNGDDEVAGRSDHSTNFAKCFDVVEVFDHVEGSREIDRSCADRKARR